ncbi:unnamed protein product [Darwinula stevensoni]|uniref:Uncharacterized protein n=1 Tax=Darwinula stevensoni TaxID=69355 RepID=A0A7R8X927_9CRUS|nr:unnamed protein product [Darwinula stevensoni]CAG0890710.1 unnamed protein product [Darwinula stevensoni]
MAVGSHQQGREANRSTKGEAKTVQKNSSFTIVRGESVNYGNCVRRPLIAVVVQRPLKVIVMACTAAEKEMWMSHIFPFWKSWVVILVPLLALPLLFVPEQRVKEGRCAYAVLVMVAFWMTDAIPMAITSLMPVFLFPLLGVLGTSEVCQLYIRESIIMFIGGIMVALAVEHCNLHQRVALRFLLWIGTSQKWLMLGFMLATMFLSMWITNTATTAMMIPIVEAVLIEIYRPSLSFSYSTMYGSETGLNYGSWMAFSVPGMLLNVILAWLWLHGNFLLDQWWERRKHLGKSGASRGETRKLEIAARAVIDMKYKELGSMSFHEFMTLILFIILILLWFFRDPQFITGWGELIIGDRYRSPALLNWSILHEKIPWGLIFLVGGGFAIAEASKTSCLSYFLGQQMRSLDFMSPALLVFITTLMATMITEVASNTATATILIPVLAQLASAVKVNPLYLMMPATLACSYAFMLPVATAPNAIVYEATQMKTISMIKAGFVVNVICVVVINLMINTDLDLQMEGRCAYVVLIMAVFWMTETVPVAVTSLIPVFLFPLLGVLDTSDVCQMYFRETSMLFIGGITVAIAVEHCNLHKRIALRILLWIGASQKWLMLGFMLTTMFLSMWITNTATTAMMVPIVEAVLMEIYRLSIGHAEQKENGNGPVTGSPRARVRKETTSYELNMPLCSNESSEQQNVEENMEENMEENVEVEFKEGYQEARIQVLLAVAYSAGIGGTGTLTGTTPNLLLKGFVDDMYGSETGLNYGSWMAFNVPGMLLNVFFAWLWLHGIFLLAQWRERRKHPEKSVASRSETTKAEIAARAVIERKYTELGSMSFHECMTLILFVTLVLLWFFRAPQFITGWAEEITGDRDLYIGDATAAMLIGFLFFIIPAKPNFWCFRESSDKPSERSPALLTWRVVQEKIPWGLLLLVGGGFAVAQASEESCLSYFLGLQMGSLGSLPPASVVFIVTLMSAMITEVASNTATATILIPVLAQLAKVVKVNPIYLMLPATVACSYAFMLPVATAPNAIVYEATQMKTISMVRNANFIFLYFLAIKAGFVMNVICVAVINMMINTLGYGIFDFSQFPEELDLQMEGRCAYVVLIMAIFWMTDALPMAITSLIPVILFPLLGVLGTSEVSTVYFKETSMLFLEWMIKMRGCTGGMMVAIAVEHCNLHKRIALRVLLWIGTSQKWSVLVSSDWLPSEIDIAFRLILFQGEFADVLRVTWQVDAGVHADDDVPVHVDHQHSNNCHDGSHRGGSPNRNLSGNVSYLSLSLFSMTQTEVVNCTVQKENDNGPMTRSPRGRLNYGSWMAFNVPGMLLNVFFAWLWLHGVFLLAQWRERRKNPEKSVASRDEATKAEIAARAVIAEKYTELGSMSFHESMTLILFVILVLLWFFRDPQFITGWAESIIGDRDLYIGDATAAMLIGILFFIIPAKPNFWCFRQLSDKPSERSTALLNWRILHEKIPWALLLLVGGGFAMAEASETSCLSYFLGQQMGSLDFMSPALLVFIVTLMSAMITEVASNTATATILIPVLAQLASVVKVNPLYLMMPATVACSYAFMLPVATAPNAIVHEATQMKTTSMMKAGFVMNVICVAVINLMINTLGRGIFDFSKFPDWAENATLSSSSFHCNYTLS